MKDQINIEELKKIVPSLSVIIMLNIIGILLLIGNLFQYTTYSSLSLFLGGMTFGMGISGLIIYFRIKKIFF